MEKMTQQPNAPDFSILIDNKNEITSLEEYKIKGGLIGLEKATTLKSEEIIDEVKRSGLRGRGGAGFPTGVKWETVFNRPCETKYVVCNAAEGEPGTFKDRYLIRKNPYQIVEGVAIAARAIGAIGAYFAIKKKFTKEIARLKEAINSMASAGFLDAQAFKICEGPDDYLFGEEKGLMEVIEGKPAIPRAVPPHEEGLFRKRPIPNPTLVNNAETFSNIPYILSRGGEWFSKIGTQGSPGTMVFTLTGDVKRPGMYELPMGTPFLDLVEKYGGGASGTAPFKFALSGVSNAVLPGEKFGTLLDFNSMKEAQSGLGSGGFMVYDETVCPVNVAHTLSRFLSLESCGQCIPCKNESAEITKYLSRIESGEGTSADLEALKKSLDAIEAGRICYLAAQENILVRSIATTYWDEFTAHIGKPCTKRKIKLPKIIDFDESNNRFVFDEAYKGKERFV
jgi:NADH:ubiquinone oxidoreductase subunit F (NADH-binding)